MWRRFTSTLADIQQPAIFPETIAAHRFPSDGFTFRRPELELFNSLFSFAPCYPVKADKIIIINEPKEFYKTLIEKCESAQKRIVLSSLYLGTGPLEKNLVSAIKNKMDNEKTLKVNVLLDFQRGSRGAYNSKSMLLPLLEESQKCRLSFYHTPYLRGFYKKWIPQRWNELIELQHMKIYLVDDSVIVSGANLSNDYFTNRQDRYIMIQDKALADFYADLISAVQSFSFQLRKDGSVFIEEGCPNPHADDKTAFINHAQQKIKELFLQSTNKQCSKGQANIDSSDTWIMPLVQAGRLNVRLDSEVTSHLLRTAPTSAQIRIATGYFNLTQDYIEALIQDCQADCTLLMAHPNANGFKGAKGPAGGVPDAYSLLAKKFYEYVKSFNQEHRFKIYEYEKAGWTYHGKGLWYYPPGEWLPSLTLIGSPNFGERSVNRDLETQIALITSNDGLRKKLQEECEMLHDYGKEPGNELFERKIPNWVKMTVRLFRNFF